MQQFERYNLPLILIFLDFIWAFELITCQKLLKILEKDRIPLKFVQLLKAYYKGSVSWYWGYREETREFPVEFWFKQGCVLSLHWIWTWKCTVFSSSSSDWIEPSLGDLEYIDDIRIPLNLEKTQTMLDNVVTWGDHMGLKVSTGF